MNLFNSFKYLYLHLFQTFSTNMEGKIIQEF